MATTFTINKQTGKASVIVRVQRSNPKVNIKLSTGIKVDAAKWLKGFDRIGADSQTKLIAIREQLDGASIQGLTSDRAKVIVRSVVHAEQIAEEARVKAEELKRQEEERRIEEERKRISFMDYYRGFLDDIKAGRAVSYKNMAFAERSRINYQQGYNKLLKYQESRGIMVDWDSLNMDFFDDYSEFLRGEGYGINTISKRFTEIKTLVHNAHDRGLTDCTIYMNRHFNVSEVEVDSIYLTRDDLDKIKAVDLSGFAPGYDQARDLFLVGVLTAQRISDYGHIQPEDIHTEEKKIIREGTNGEPDRIETIETTFIDILQRKTGARVRIPANAELRAILAKYGNKLPHLCDQVLNRYIKQIAKAAGLTDIISIKSTKGGVNTVERVEKWTLVHSHTARRTGCTLMYLAGIDMMDICRISGHQSEKMLRKYIRSSELENAVKFATRYDYFR